MLNTVKQCHGATENLHYNAMASSTEFVRCLKACPESVDSNELRLYETTMFVIANTITANFSTYVPTLSTYLSQCSIKLGR